MYPTNPPPGNSDHDQYPLNQFTAHDMDRSSPFSDPYPQEAPGPGGFDHQPLLHNPPMGFQPPPPPGGPPSPFAEPSPHAGFAPSPQVPGSYPPGSPNLHYGAAPRRQPRRFKTSK